MNLKLMRVKRYKEIIAVFTKQGFGFIMKQLNSNYNPTQKKSISDVGIPTENAGASAGKRLRMALEELGPTFVKLGQLLSIRQEILPIYITDELKKLQDSVQPFPFSQVKELIETQFNDKLENIFKEIDERPLAAASMSQVHCARLITGKKVAVKVQRPGIEKIIELDLDILKDMAQIFSNHTKYGESYDFIGMVKDFENTLKNELDFTKEGENADTFMCNFSRDEGITVPKVKWIYTAKRVLTMEYIHGIRVDDYNALEKAGISTQTLGKRLVTSIYNQILRDGFFHADPHPGNIRVLPDGTIVFLDFGMVGYLNEARKKKISDFFIGIVSKDSRRVVKSIIDSDTVASRSNLKKFEKDVDKIIEKYLTMPWSEIKIETVLYETFNIAFLNNIKIPREFAMLAKTLGTLQSYLEKLAPDLNALVVAKPIAKKLIYQSFSLDSISNDMKKSLWDYRDLLKYFPSTVLSFLAKMEDDDFAIQLEIKNLDRVEGMFDRIFNRISFSVILLAVSIIIVGIVIASSLSTRVGSEMYLINVTALKVSLIIAGIIILGLLISMFKPRH